MRWSSITTFRVRLGISSFFVEKSYNVVKYHTLFLCKKKGGGIPEGGVFLFMFGNVRKLSWCINHL